MDCTAVILIALIIVIAVGLYVMYNEYRKRPFYVYDTRASDSDDGKKYELRWEKRDGSCEMYSDNVPESWAEYVDVIKESGQNECWYNRCYSTEGGQAVKRFRCTDRPVKYGGCYMNNTSEAKNLISSDLNVCNKRAGTTNDADKNPIIPTPVVTYKPRIVVRAWGSGKDTGYTTTPFNKGDYVVVQGAYPYGKDNLEMVTRKGGVPVSYYSVGSYESKDPYRVKFYGPEASFLQECLGEKIPNWNEYLYDPSRLEELIPLQEMYLGKLRAFGFEGVEFDNMDFANIYDNDAKAHGQIERYIVALAKTARSLGMKVFAKNYYIFLKKHHDLFDGLITESVSDNACFDELKIYSDHFGKSTNRPWSDYIYKDEIKCRQTEATVWRQNANDVWVVV